MVLSIQTDESNVLKHWTFTNTLMERFDQYGGHLPIHSDGTVTFTNTAMEHFHQYNAHLPIQRWTP